MNFKPLSYSICIVICLSSCIATKNSSNLFNKQLQNTNNTICKRETAPLSVFVQQNATNYIQLKSTSFLIDTPHHLQFIEYGTLDTSLLENFINSFINIQEQKISDLVFLVLYYGTNYKNFDTLNANSLQAIGVYTLQQQHYYFALFQKINNRFVLNEDLSGITYVTTVAPFLKIGTDIIYNSKNSFSYLILSQKYNRNMPNITGQDLLSQRLKLYYTKHNIVNTFNWDE